ncbi:MAG: hypothetical protein MJ154_00370 [Candidatus Saccharibacteria bacterium]|nr:hypothetical protein [Candidatus Saccharibacteria bacterium]
MKSVWTKVSAVALAGVIIANAFIPYAYATDIDPAQMAKMAEEAKTEEFFSIEEKILNFGQLSELGRSYTKSIVVKNNTANDVIIDASTSVYEDVAVENQKITEWITFVGGITHFSVSAGASRDINVRVVVPSDAASGTQYANVELKDANGHTDKVLVKADIAGDGLKYSSEVSDATIEPFALGENLKGKVVVKNTGTAGFTSVYQIRAKNVFGGMDWIIVDEGEEEVFPSKQVEFSTDDKLGFGVYNVEQRVTFANAEGRMVESLLSRMVINIPTWSLAVAGGVIVFIIIVAIFAKRRKKNRNKDKLKNAERKARAAEIKKVERAEGKAIDGSSKGVKIDEDLDAELDAIEEFSVEDNGSEIERLAEKLEARGEEQEDEPEEEVPVKVNVVKKKPAPAPAAKDTAKKPVKKIKIIQ